MRSCPNVGFRCGKLLTALVAAIAVVLCTPGRVGADVPCEPSWDFSASFPESDESQEVQSLAVFDDGGGPNLYVGGRFTSIGGVEAQNIARWDGKSWTALGPGVNGAVYAMIVFDDGSGPALYVGGRFTKAGALTVNRVARWDGQQWSALGNGVGSGTEYVANMAAFDDGSGQGPELYVGGRITPANGTPSHIFKWNGSSWSSPAGGMNDRVTALAVFDDGNGSALYAGGYFTIAGGNPANHMARWNGSSWSPLGDGLSGDSNTRAHALQPFDDGSGPALAAAGVFTAAGGVPANKIARWDGETWAPLGSGVSGGFNQVAYALGAFDDGTAGKQLYVAGNFLYADGFVVNNIAKWNGQTWGPVGDGLGSDSSFPLLFAMTEFDDGGGPALYVGGKYSHAIPPSVGGGPDVIYNLAAWRACLPRCDEADLNCDGVVDGADLGILLAAWGPCDDCNDCPADLNDDCTVDGADLGILLANWS